MPTFIVLGKFDRQGLETLLPPPKPDGDKKRGDTKGKRKIAARDEDLPDRELVEWLAGKVNATLEDLWFTTGRYDVVMRLEAESGVSVLAFALSFARVAGASTETLAAEADVDEVLKIARDAHTRHHTRHEARG
jgi:uncharacterized protein with GYD domain